MGTAGPLGLARKLLDDGSGDPFFVLNRWAHTQMCKGYVGGWPQFARCRPREQSGYASCGMH